jgi:lipoyl(octanoyl) transferase
MRRSDEAGGLSRVRPAGGRQDDPAYATSSAPRQFTGVEWLESRALVDYPTAVSFMERRVEAIIRGAAPEAVWLLEHPPIYTLGTSACDTEIFDRQRFPVYRTGRGGRITYHGPGQRVGYVMLDLQQRKADVRLFVCQIEEWLIRALATFGVGATRCPGKIGVWVTLGPDRQAKIAAIGIRVRRWISFHGFALNVDPDLSHFGGIVPCGLADSEITSLRKLGLAVGMRDVDAALKATFATVFAAPETGCSAISDD